MSLPITYKIVFMHPRSLQYNRYLGCLRIIFQKLLERSFQAFAKKFCNKNPASYTLLHNNICINVLYIFCQNNKD